MTDQDQSTRSEWIRRVWAGAFGTFLGALLGMVAAAAMQGSLLDGLFYGAPVGFALGFLLGLEGVCVLLWWRP